MKNLILIFLSIAIITTTYSKDFEVGAGISAYMFQQQVKAEVGDPRGDRLTYDFVLSNELEAYYILNDFISLGLFLRYDTGNNRAARFSGIGEDGLTNTTGVLEGTFDELWVGPRLRLKYEGLFGEFGYGLFGYRRDDLRSDLFSSSGDNNGNFNLNPSIAYQFKVGYGFDINDDWILKTALEWRLRYYQGRSGVPFLMDIEHGTMNLQPFVGVAYSI
ncbi:MAG: hypothetical protein Kapaf2KO_04310 [Candidatus Kapaibacteriales bacterium]